MVVYLLSVACLTRSPQRGSSRSSRVGVIEVDRVASFLEKFELVKDHAGADHKRLAKPWVVLEVLVLICH